MPSYLGRVARETSHVLVHLLQTAVDTGDAAFAFLVAKDWLLANQLSPEAIGVHSFEAAKLVVACIATVCTVRAGVRSVTGLYRVIFERK
jgi:hypothetical protein